MRKLKDRAGTFQRELAKKFVLPEDISEVYLDKYDRPFKLISGNKVMCSVRTNNFHIHETKNK